MKKKRNSMKYIYFLLLGVCMCFSVNVRAQSTKITLDMKNVHLTTVFTELSKQSSYSFFYNYALMQSKGQVSVKAKDKDMTQILEELLPGLGLEYSFDGKVVVIREKKADKGKKQEYVIQGVVLDKEKQPMPGVTVKVVGTSLGTATDMDGKFVLRLPLEEGKLEFSFIGCKTQQKDFTGTKGKMLQIVMEEDMTEMDEVVVTGIFSKSKESYTGAVSVITEKELKSFGSRNILQTLRNIDPSFNILENNQYGSDPNKIPEVQMRGTASVPAIDDLQKTTKSDLNTPLIILDGFETTLERMMDLDDSEVKSITLLKDASATAIYGSRGANGVIVIETKEPEAGKLSFSYTGKLDVEMPDLSSYDLLNARDKLDLEFRSGFYSGSTSATTVKLQQKYADLLYDVERGVDTYWLSKPLRTGVGHRHNVRLDGGSESFRYALTLSYNNTAGVMKGSERTNFNGGIDLSYTHEKLVFRNSLSIGLNKAVNSPYGNFADYVKLNPYWTEYDENGKMKKFFDEDGNFWTTGFPSNPLYDATLNTRNTSDYTSITNNFSMEWKPIDGLQVRTRFGVSAQTTNSDLYLSPEHTNFQTYGEDDYFRRGSYNYSVSDRVRWDVSLTLNYSKLFKKKHLVYVGANMDMEQEKTNLYSFLVEGFASGTLDHLASAMAYAKDGQPRGSEGKSRGIGFVGNLNYSYASRFLADFSYRVDGSSKFGSDRRFAGFWSVGVGWNIHQEKFMQNQSYLNRVKLRGSVGETGANTFSPYETVATFKYDTDSRYDIWMGAKQVGMANPKLEWQKTMKYDVGLEMDLFNNRLSLVGDIYLERTDGLVSSMELAPSNGFSGYKANIGKLENRGFEVRTTVYAIRNTEKEIMWSIMGSVVRNDEKIIKLSKEMQEANKEMLKRGGSSPTQIWLEGHSSNAIYVVPSLGIDPSSGKELLVKRDGDVSYTWDAADRVACGVSQPKYRGNFNTMFTWRNLSLNVSFGYHWGGQKYNTTLIDRVENADKKYNVDKRVYYDRWIKVDDMTFFKGINETTRTRMSSRFVQDDAEFTCRNLNVSYEFRQEWVKNLGIKRLLLTGNMSDVFRISTIKQERGTSYPFARSFAMSISAMF